MDIVVVLLFFLSFGMNCQKLNYFLRLSICLIMILQRNNLYQGSVFLLYQYFLVKLSDSWPVLFSARFRIDFPHLNQVISDGNHFDKITSLNPEKHNLDSIIMSCIILSEVALPGKPSLIAIKRYQILAL